MLFGVFFSTICIASSSNIIEWKTDEINFVRELKGTGLKRDLYTKIEINHLTDCILYENISNDWFIDIEEVPKVPKFSFKSIIDIELPSSLSKNHEFSISIGNTKEFIYPIHIRYNDCSESEYKKIAIVAPILKCGKKVYQIKGEINALVPIGNLKDLPSVTFITIITTLIGVIWIYLTIRKYKNNY